MLNVTLTGQLDASAFVPRVEFEERMGRLRSACDTLAQQLTDLRLQYDRLCLERRKPSLLDDAPPPQDSNPKSRKVPF